MTQATRYAESHCSIGTKASNPDNILGSPNDSWATCSSVTPEDIFGKGFNVTGLFGTINSIQLYFRIKTSGFKFDRWRLEHDWGDGNWVIDFPDSKDNVGSTDYGPYTIDITGKNWSDIPNIRLHLQTVRNRIDTALAEIDAVWIIIDYTEIVTGFRKLQYFTEPPTSDAFNKLRFASEPPVGGAWNKLLYEGE